MTVLVIMGKAMICKKRTKMIHLCYAYSLTYLRKNELNKDIFLGE